MRVHAEESWSVQASTIPVSSVVETNAEASAQESAVEESAVETSSTAAGSFDYSYFFVLALGIAGLVWVRRQSQSL